ncbi:MAG: MFS transporter [Humibacter sp.]
MVSDSTKTKTGFVREVDARMDAMKRVPLGTAGFIGLLICYVATNYDIGVFALVGPSILNEFHVEATALAIPVFWNLVGYAVGSYGFGYLADRWGRQRGILAVVIGLSLGAVLAAFSWDIASLSFFRFIAGAGIGASLSLLSGYISEFAPPDRRGRYLAYLYTFQAVLLMLSSIASPPILGVLPSIGWRLLLGFGVIAIFVIPFLNRRALMESPRWLAQANRKEAAERNLTILESRLGIKPESAVQDEGGAIEIEPLTASINTENRIKPWRLLIQRPYLGRMITVLLFWIFFYFTNYAFTSYTPIILQSLGISPANALTITVWSRILSIGMPFLLIFIIERVERRTLMMSGAGLMVLGCLALLLPLGGLSSYFGSLLVIAGVSLTVTPGYIYVSEVFPTQARGTAAALSDGLGHMGSAIAGFVVLPIIVAGFGSGAVWVMIASAVLAIVVLLFGPRTRNKRLTDLAPEG